MFAITDKMDYLCNMIDKRNEKRKQWFESHPDLQPNFSMKRRKAGHDYRSRCIYMLTLVVEGRRPLLGELRASDEKHPRAWIKPSELGNRVLKCWREVALYHPQIRLIAVQLMPDHFHGVLFVTERMPRHLGQVVNGFKKGCNDFSRQLLGTTLWEMGYHDRILRDKHQLVRMVRYLHDNPYRLWTKRHNPELFSVHHDIVIGEHKVAIAGNRFLLDFPFKVAVKCSRSLSEDDINREIARYLLLARDGAILVSPCISPGEKAVMRVAFEAGVKEIVPLENGFSEMWKPGGAQFDACSEGRLLLVAPWPHHNDRRLITRAQCNKLNELAREIATL